MTGRLTATILGRGNLCNPLAGIAREVCAAANVEHFDCARERWTSSIDP